MLNVSLMHIGGFYIKMRKWPILILIGFWSLSAFVLHNFYTTLLISDVTAPKSQPLINSIYDLRHRSDLNLVTDRKGNTLALLSVSIKIY